MSNLSEEESKKFVLDGSQLKDLKRVKRSPSTVVLPSPKRQRLSAIDVETLEPTPSTCQPSPAKEGREEDESLDLTRSRAKIVEADEYADPRAKFPLPASVTSTFSAFPSFIINPPPDLSFTIQRVPMAKAYKKNAQSFIQRIDPHVLFWPQFAVNPAMPIRPGLPGAIFSPRTDIFDQPLIKSVFHKVTSNGWLYLGEYEVDLSDTKLTGTTFANLPQKVLIMTGFIF